MSSLLVVGFNPGLSERIRVAAAFAEVDYVSFSDADALFESADTIAPRFIIISTIGVNAKESIAGEVQSIKQFFPNVFVMVVAEKKITGADAKFLKKSGANYVILENEFFQSIRLEYFLIYVVKCSLTPVKVSDLKIGTTIPFKVLSILPLNRKVVPVIPKGTLFSEEKQKKLLTINEIYISREDLESYVEYFLVHEDKSANGLSSRCRAQFQVVASMHTNLMMNLTDQSEQGSYEGGKQILDKILKLCNDLLLTLATVPEPWNIIDQSAIGTIGATDRSMFIASMAALTSFLSGLGVAEEIMFGGLFCDLGLLDLSPKCLALLNSTEDRERLPAEDLNAYTHHPLISLNRLLERKIQLSDRQKEIILCTHEQMDKCGFPRKVAPEKIPIESALIYFHELIDLEFRMQMGKQRLTYIEARQKVLDRELKSGKKFSLLLLETIRKHISNS